MGGFSSLGGYDDGGDNPNVDTSSVGVPDASTESMPDSGTGTMQDPSTPVAQPAIPDGSPSPMQAGAAPAIPATPPVSPLAPSQSPWQKILGSVFTGLSGIDPHSHTFFQGLTGGAKAQIEQQRYDQQTAMQQQKQASDIRFQNAQAANLVAETRIRDYQLHAMPQQDQDAHNSASLQQLETMKQMGLTPTIVSDNNTGGKEAMAGLQSLTASHDGVPPMFTINVGNKVIGFDLNQLTQQPQALDQVNKVRAIQGAQPYDAQTWASLPPAQKVDATNNAFGFFNPMPSEDNLLQYKNYVLTAQAMPDGDQKDATLAALNPIVSRMTTALDNQKTRSDAQKAATTASDTTAKANAQNAADNSPSAIAGAARKAGAVAGAEQRAKNQADQEAIGNNVDPFGVQTGVTPEGQKLAPKEYNARADKFGKDYVQPLNVLAKSTEEFDRINNNPNQTGAEKVTALLNAVGISGDPLKGKGFRISNDVINEHAAARNIWETGVQKLNTVFGSGGPITKDQINDYTNIAKGVVHDAYVTAAQEARRQGLPVNFLPKPTKQGSVIDPFTAKIYLDAAGGNAQAAHAAAVKAGYAQ